MVEAAMELPRLIKEDKGAQAITRLNQKIAGLREKRVSFPGFLQRLRVQRGGEGQDDPEIQGVLDQAQKFVMAELEKKRGEPLTARDLSQMARKAVEVLSVDATSEEKERLDFLGAKITEFEAEGISGKVSEDPREEVARLMVAVVGEEGRQLYETVAQATGENPYPKPEEKQLPKGLKSRGQYALAAGCSIALLACCFGSALSTTVATRIFVGPEKEATTREEIEKANEEWAIDSLIDGSYGYEEIEKWLGRGGLAAERARNRLDTVAIKIMDGEMSLNEVTDPRLIARLIYDYQMDYPIFQIETIADFEKRMQAEKHLGQLFEEQAPRREPGVIIEKEQSEYLRPSQRQTAMARSQQKAVSFQAKATEAPPKSYQARGGRFYSKGKASGGKRA